MTRQTFIAGLSVNHDGENATQLLQKAKDDQYDFVTTFLPHSSNEQTLSNRLDITTLEARYWSTSVVGTVTDPLNDHDFTRRVDEWITHTHDKSHGDVTTLLQKYTIQNKGQRLVASLSNPQLSHKAEQYLTFMLDWASHMNIPAVILPSITEQSKTQYARLLSTLALTASASRVQLWVRVPFTKQGLYLFTIVHKLCDLPSNLGCMLVLDTDSCSSTQHQQQKYTMGENLALLHQMIGCNLRAISFDTQIFLTNSSNFPTLSKNHQILFCELLKRLGQTCRILVEGEPFHHLSSLSDDMGRGGKSGFLSYLQYLRHLRSKEEVTCILDTVESQMEASYLDHLQSALQPLGDNLEFATYETFERDPVKYERYREAVEIALMDKIMNGELNNYPINEMTNDTIFHTTILVVGAGRGPLVQASLDAVTNVNQQNKNILGSASKFIVKAHVVAVEKNPSAMVYLHSRKAHDTEWKNTVSIVECDMRYADTHPFFRETISMGDEAQKADIVVSELLGSFGCNELSPECLDGLQRSGILKEDAVSIPQSYTSYLAPVSSMRLHSEAQAQSYVPFNALEGPGGKPSGTLQAMETPYVVRSHAASQLQKELPCWEFVHPVRNNSSSASVSVNKNIENSKMNGRIKDAAMNVNNDRYAELTFSIDSSYGAMYGCGYGVLNSSISNYFSNKKKNNDDARDGSNDVVTIHGFLGTFHSTLYQSVNDSNQSSCISTAPTSFSRGMFSWFPLYFPLREPILLSRSNDNTLRCFIWRKTSGGKVWYEWCAEVLCGSEVLNASSVHNPNGRSSHVRL